MANIRVRTRRVEQLEEERKKDEPQQPAAGPKDPAVFDKRGNPLTPAAKARADRASSPAAGILCTARDSVQEILRGVDEHARAP